MLKQLALDPTAEFQSRLLERIVLDLVDQGDLSVWADLADHPQAEVRTQAMIWASSLGPQALPTLKTRLSDENPLVRLIAANGYHSLGGDRRVAALVILEVAKSEGGLAQMVEIPEFTVAPYAQELYDDLLDRALKGDETAGTFLSQVLDGLPEKLEELVPLYDRLPYDPRSKILQMLTDGSKPSEQGVALLGRLSESSSMEGYWSSEALWRFGYQDWLVARIRSDFEGPSSTRLEQPPEYLAMAHLQDHRELWPVLLPDLEQAMERWKDAGIRAQGLQIVLEAGSHEQVLRILERDLHRHDRCLGGVLLSEELARELSPKLTGKDRAEIAADLERHLKDPELPDDGNLIQNARLLLR